MRCALHARPPSDDRRAALNLPDPGLPVPVRREPALTTELELKLVRLNHSRNGKEPQPVGCVDELELAIWRRSVRFERDRSDAAAVNLVRPDVHCAASHVNVSAYLGSRDELHRRIVGEAAHRDASGLSWPLGFPSRRGVAGVTKDPPDLSLAFGTSDLGLNGTVANLPELPQVHAESADHCELRITEERFTFHEEPEPHERLLVSHVQAEGVKEREHGDGKHGGIQNLARASDEAKSYQSVTTRTTKRTRRRRTRRERPRRIS